MSAGTLGLPSLFEHGSRSIVPKNLTTSPTKSGGVFHLSVRLPVVAVNALRAVDFLRPIYENNWNLEYVDGSMVGGLAATYNLIEACGSGDKAKGLRTYLKDYFSNVSRSKWTENTRGQSDVLIARKIVNKYNDLCDQGIIEGATIGEDLLTNNKLKDPATL